MNRAVFLDRDGVINKRALPHEYITSWKEFEFLPGVKEALKKLANNYPHYIFIATNQAGIFREKVSLDNLKEIHFNMVREIEEAGGRIDKIYVCPHGYEGCDCRKPLPGMLDMAKEEFDIDLKESWVIGDDDTDIKFGKARNCKTIYIGESCNEADYVVANLEEAIDLIIGS